MPWVIFDSDGQYLSGSDKHWKWTMMLKRACKLDTEAEARAFGEKHARKRQWWVIEVSWQEVRGKKDAEPPRAWLPHVLSMEKGRDMTDREIAELPARALAVRLVFGDRMPAGVHNPYFHKLMWEDRHGRRIAKLVDALAARILAGEDVRPRDSEGNVALPLSRMQAFGDETVPARMMPPTINMTGHVIRKRIGERV